MTDQPPIGSIVDSEAQLAELYRAPSRLVAAKKMATLDFKEDAGTVSGSLATIRSVSAVSSSGEWAAR